MDILDILINFFNLNDNSNFLRIQFNKMTDKNEYLGVRVIGFLSIFISFISFIFFIHIIYLIII